MSFRPTYYGGFPGPPANHFNQPRNQGLQRGFNPQQYVQPLQDVTFYPDPNAPNFYPAAVTPTFSGSPLYPPEYGLPPNYPMHYPPEYYFEPQSYPSNSSSSPPSSNPPAAVDASAQQFNPNKSSSQNLINLNPHSPKFVASKENSPAALSGKSRRFSHQRNIKDAAAGTSGEMFGSANQSEVVAKGRGRKIVHKHSIRFSHQREIVPKTQKNKENELDESNESTECEAAFAEGGQHKPKTKHEKENGTKKKNIRVIPPDNRNQATVLEDQLSYGTYECMVCCDRVRPQHAIWNCLNCYNLFHMGCIKKWARSPAAKYEESGWRCPGCQHVTKNVPNTYYCFCGKSRDPEYRRGEITPHSCGDMCGRKRKSNPDCIHPCNILCHPGPCPQCPAMINKSCKCKKVTSRIRCSQQRNFMCENPCGKLRNCGIHECEDVCHDGECRACSIEVEQACYCGRVSRKVVCGSEDHIQSIAGEGSYSCGKICKKQLECGNHQCHEVCHVGPCKSCSLLPSAVTVCPCTQTKLSDLKNEDGSPVERKHCTDPIPTCGKTCGKPLRCGGDEIHMCKLPCHAGDCPPCLDGVSTAKCRCGKSEKDFPCKDFVKMRNYICERRCFKKKKCGKHKCRNTCCVDKQHECTQTCGRRLTCGGHYCGERCHRGACHTCYNVSFDELHCHCGAEVIFPPIACGTKPPECNRECARIHSCTHPVRHTCHSEASCPPCVELVKKPCNCGRVVRSNIMCHVVNVSCGEKCGKTLACGHKCPKICHMGSCVDEDVKCKQPCSIIRPDCVHPCAEPCHTGQPCPITPCKAMVTMRCSCGRREEVVKCSEGGSIVQSVNSAISSSKEAVDIHKLLRPGTSNLKTLHCDEECAVLARNRRFAEALDIDTDDYSSVAKQRYSEFLTNFAKSDSAFVCSVERELINLVEKVGWLSFIKQSHSFPPMKREKRQVVHELAEAFHCKSESHDHEPKRNVVVTAEKGKCKQPTPLLSDAVKEKAQSQKKVSPKIARKGLLSSMKLVSYSSAEKSRENDVKTKQTFQQKQTPFTPAGPYKPPHRVSSSNSTSGAMEQLSRQYEAASINSSRKTSTLPPSKKEEPSKAIDYFDMTD